MTRRRPSLSVAVAGAFTALIVCVAVIRMPSQGQELPVTEASSTAINQTVDAKGAFDRWTKSSNEEAIRTSKRHIQLAVKNFHESKDDKSMREALDQLERAVQFAKTLLPPPK